MNPQGNLKCMGPVRQGKCYGIDDGAWYYILYACHHSSFNRCASCFLIRQYEVILEIAILYWDSRDLSGPNSLDSNRVRLVNLRIGCATPRKFAALFPNRETSREALLLGGESDRLQLACSDDGNCVAVSVLRWRNITAPCAAKMTTKGSAGWRKRISE